MALSCRVQKRAAEKSRKNKRGRPKKYSDSWTKKLLLLCMCGLHVTDVVRILGILEQGPFAARDRRPQQLVRKLLSDGEHRFHMPDKQAARDQARFLRSAIGRSRRTKSNIHASMTIRRSLTKTSPLILADEEKKACGSAVFPETGWQIHGNDVDHHLNAASPNDGLEIQFDTATRRYSLDSVHTQRSNPVDLEPSKITQLDPKDTEDALSKDHEKLVPNWGYTVREMLRRSSLASSFVSDLLSLLDKRHSLSTFSTASRVSLPESFAAVPDFSSSQSKAADVLKQRLKFVKCANAALVSVCCSNLADCRHKYITYLVKKDPFLVNLRPGDLKVHLQSKLVTDSRLDPYGNTDLFFAARVGAHADVVIALIAVTSNINDLNADGQSFLYFLDPISFINSPCNCPRGLAHSSKFECVVRALERRGFEFDHLDNYGRHFLSYLCSSSSFNIQWLCDLIRRDSTWKHRVGRVSQLRDSTGTYLIDFMALHPRFETWDEDVRSLFRPLFVHNPMHAVRYGILSDEDDIGRTRLHLYLQGDFLHTSTLRDLEVPLHYGQILSDINRYDSVGRTPIMGFLLKAFEQDIDEDIICAKVQQLLLCGANVNACSRGGSTILHFAAKKALPKLLELLLATHIQIYHCDNDGLCAVDYAARVFRRSRYADESVGLAARSLKSTAQLLASISNAFGKERLSFIKLPKDDISERSLQTLQKLIGTNLLLSGSSLGINFRQPTPDCTGCESCKCRGCRPLATG